MSIKQSTPIFAGLCRRQIASVGIRSFSSNNGWLIKPPSFNWPYTHGKHRSNAEELIAKVPVVEVDTTVAVCDGGGGTLGHPLEYIQVNTAVPGQVQTCKYCGIRYKMKAHHH